MNKRYKEVFKSRVDNFISEMSRAKSLYEDLNKKNKLLHAGEYGMYKERTFRELIEFVKPFKYDATDGYVINSYDETSTQCDIILFDKLNAPLISFGDRFQFIPAESVAAIGEVKSILTKKDFIDTVIKLSKNKEICKPSLDYISNNKTFKAELFSPFTFLICDSISGINNQYTYKELIKDLVERYRIENIEVNNYFNINPFLNFVLLNDQIVPSLIELIFPGYINSFLKKNL